MYSCVYVCASLTNLNRTGLGIQKLPIINAISFTQYKLSPAAAVATLHIQSSVEDKEIPTQRTYYNWTAITHFTKQKKNKALVYT